MRRFEKHVDPQQLPGTARNMPEAKSHHTDFRNKMIDSVMASENEYDQ